MFGIFKRLFKSQQSKAVEEKFEPTLELEKPDLQQGGVLEESERSEVIALTGEKLETQMAELWDQFERRSSQYVDNGVSEDTNPRLYHWYGSINYSGYQREKSLLYLMSHYQEGDENRILLRLGDWVPGIRLLAEDWLKENLSKLPFESILKNAKLLLYLSRKRALQNTSILKHINETLLLKIRESSKENFFLLPPNFRKYLFKISVTSDFHLRDWILDDPDPINRSLLLQVEELSSQEVERLKQDKSLFILRRFYRLRVKNGEVLSEIELKYLSLHPNLSMRTFARFYLREFYEVDAYDFYRECTGDQRYYLADYAKKEDVDLFLKGTERLKDKNLRLQCLKALLKVAPERLREMNLSLLLNQGRKQRKAIVEQVPYILNLEEIVGMKPVLVSTSKKGLFQYLEMIRKKSLWAFVEHALEELESKESLLREKSQFAYIDHGLERKETKEISLFIQDHIGGSSGMYEKVSSVQKIRIKKQLELLEQVNPEAVKKVRFLMKHVTVVGA